MRFLLTLLVLITPVVAVAGELPDGPAVAALMEKRQVAVKKTIHDLTVIQAVTVDNGSATTLNEVKAYVKGEKSRTEIVATNPNAPDNVPEAYKKVTSLIIGDGTERWSFHSIRGVRRIDESDRQQAPLAGPRGLKERLAAGAKVEGEERIAGRDCWKISYDVEQTPVVLWLDRKDFFPVRQEWSEERVSVVQYSDTFLATDAGVDIPSRTVTLRDGKETAVTVVKDVVVNSGLDDKLFDVAEIRRRVAEEPSQEGIVARAIRRIKTLLGME